MAAAAAAMVWVPILEDGVFRFDASEAARAAAGPSLSFAEPRRREVVLLREGVDGDGPAVVPECQVVGDIVHKVLIKLPFGTSLYGTGEASGPLERTGKRVFTWNTDAWGYGPGTTSLYQSHPWVLSILPDGKVFGVLADTTHRCEINLRQEFTIKFSASSAYPIITFGPFDTPDQVMTSLSLPLELCPCLQNGLLAIINVALAISLPRESSRLLEPFERKAFLAMWFGWILTIWMVSDASHLTMTISLIQNLWLMICIPSVVNQSGCLIQELRKKRVTLCMKVVQKMTCGLKRQMVARSLVRYGLVIVFSLTSPLKESAHGGLD